MSKTRPDEEILKENDHKKLGKELDLFTFSGVVGKGLPLWTPKGAIIRRELERWVVDEELNASYQHVYTPDLAKLELYEKSGHYPYYKDSMYSPIDIEGEMFMLRPMSCPHHFELYLSRPHSYKELPIRYAELAKLYRFEKSGELMGLQRVRSFCLADAHIICRKDQAEAEIAQVLDLIERLAKTLGLKDDYYFRLSLGDRNDEKKFFKDDVAWGKAEKVLKNVLDKKKIAYKVAKGEAAFYGPKIDIQMRNANGKEDTAFTVQYDFVMPKKFHLNYTSERGQEEEAVVIHRSSIGAIERVIAFLIEKYAGAFPAWLAPVQAVVLPITDRHLEYANAVAGKLREAGLRIEVDNRNETLSAKIRDGEMQKIPYLLVIGDQEEKEEKIAVRSRDRGDLGKMRLQKLTDTLRIEIKEKRLGKTIQS